jgi:hypothetical protein
MSPSDTTFHQETIMSDLSKAPDVIQSVPGPLESRSQQIFLDVVQLNSKIALGVQSAVSSLDLFVSIWTRVGTKRDSNNEVPFCDALERDLYERHCRDRSSGGLW